jgi:hypothetical protein
MARREKHAAQFAQSATSAANFISVIFWWTSNPQFLYLIVIWFNKF